MKYVTLLACLIALHACTKAHAADCLKPVPRKYSLRAPVPVQSCAIVPAALAPAPLEEIPAPQVYIKYLYLPDIKYLYLPDIKYLYLPDIKYLYLPDIKYLYLPAVECVAPVKQSWITTTWNEITAAAPPIRGPSFLAAPEIDPAQGTAALTLLAGAVIVLRSRK